jgi:hypothetical protein
MRPECCVLLKVGRQTGAWNARLLFGASRFLNPNRGDVVTWAA